MAAASPDRPPATARWPQPAVPASPRRRRRTAGLPGLLLWLLLWAGTAAPVAGRAQPAGGPAPSRWSPTWAGGGFWSDRNWVWGWYRANPAVWGWWPSRAAAWGVSGLSSAATVTDRVNRAIAAQSSLITVPETDLRLDFGSVQAVRPMAARFVWMEAGGAPRPAAADCQSGELDGAPPADLRQAELLNAACQVVYGAP
jgi:hypothetical protein